MLDDGRRGRRSDSGQRLQLGDTRRVDVDRCSAGRSDGAAGVAVPGVDARPSAEDSPTVGTAMRSPSATGAARLRASAIGIGQRPSGGDDGVGDALAGSQFVDAGRSDCPRDVDHDGAWSSAAARRIGGGGPLGGTLATTWAASARAASGSRDSVGTTGDRSNHQATPARTRTAPAAPRSRPGPTKRSHGTTRVGQGSGADAISGRRSGSSIDIDIVVGSGDHSLPPRLCATQRWRTVGRDVGESDASATEQRTRQNSSRLSFLR